MLKYIAIILIVAVVIIAGASYWLYSKIKTQELSIQQLIQNQLTLNAKLTRPPDNQEVLTILKPQIIDTDTTTTKSGENCEDCELKPVLLPTIDS